MFATGFADAQRVAPMVQLLRCFAKMGDMKPGEFGDQQNLFGMCYRELRILA
jgi:hypothetical protein